MIGVIVPRVPPRADAVARHYDELDPFYRELWGDHVHHGWFASRRTTPAEAVVALADRVAERAEVSAGDRVCDVGCGYGGTAERLVERYRASVVGLTLSAAQRAVAAGRELPRATFLLRDWLRNDLPAASFDAAIAIESTEHMEPKDRVFSEAYRVLVPGGRFAVCAWLASASAKPWEVRRLLEPICREGRLAGLGTEEEYVAFAREAGFAVESFEDGSREVRRTWSVVARRLAVRLLRDGRYRRFLLDARRSERVFALTIVRLAAAYRTGAMRYGVFGLRKPAPG